MDPEQQKRKDRRRRQESALELGTQVVTLGCKLLLGPGGEIVRTLGDLLIKDQVSRFEQRRVDRMLQTCIDLISERSLQFLESELPGLSENERNAALLATAETFERSGVTSTTFTDLDLDASLVWRYLQPASNVVLKGALLSEGAAQLYQRVLKESCEYLVQFVVTIPQFQTNALQVLLRRETIILKELEEVLRRLPSPDSDNRYEPEYLRFSAEYRRVIINKLNRMELLGTSVSNATRNYPLTASYISLRVLPKDSDAQARETQGKQQALLGRRIEDVLADCRRILIVGEAGSGKTTLLRYLAVAAAQRIFPDTLASWNGVMPFLISLRQYAQRGTTIEFPSPKHFPNAIAYGACDGMPDNWVSNHLRDGQAVVLVDGLDEVPEGGVRRRATEWLNDIILRYPEARYVVTSRPAAVDQWSDNSFIMAELQPMSSQDIRAFIRNWHKAIYREIGQDEEREELREDEQALNFAIDNDRNLRRLAVNPLLCALLCALNRDRRGILPKARMEIYSAALEMLLDRRDRERGISDLLDYSAQQTILRELGFWLLRQGLATAPMDRVEKCIERSLSSIPAVQAKPSVVLKYLLTRSGVLREPSVGNLDFVHKTFQEYLAAQAAIEDDEIEMLVKHAPDDQWREVIIMAVGHAQRRQREDLFVGLIDSCSTVNLGSRSRVALLTVACLQTAAQIDIEIRRKVEEVARDLLPPKTMDEAVSLAPVGDLALEVLVNYPPRIMSEAASSIRLASLVGGEQAMKTIGEIASKIDGVEHEVLRAAWAFDPEQYAQQVFTKARFGKELTVTDEGLLRHIGLISSLERLRFEADSLADLSGLGSKPPRLTSVSLSVPARSNLRGLERWKGLTDLTIEMDHLMPDLSPVGLLDSLQVLRVIVKNGISLNINLLPLRNLSSLRYIELIVDSYARVDPAQMKGRSGLTIAGSRTVDFVGRPISGITVVYLDKTSTPNVGLLPRERPEGTF